MKRVVSNWVSLSSGLVIAACGGATPATPAVPVQTAALGDAGALGPVDLGTAPVSEQDALVPIAADDPTWGSRLAPVTIVAFEDFQCPFCARSATTIAKLEAKYGPQKLRVVLKHLPLPFHPNARPAAEAAEGVRALGGNDAFWRFSALAFENQRDLGPEAYARWARDAGIDGASLAKGLASGAWSAKVHRDEALAEKLGIDGTPAFLVNGVVISGAQPASAFEAVMDAELTKVDALVASGVARDRVYAAETEANLKAQIAAAKSDVDRPDTNVYKVPVGASPVLGAKDAAITIVEFSDFECPFCKRVEDTLKEVRAKYGGDVRVVWKNEPLSFHPHAKPAAELALEARAQKGDAGFWAAHDALLAAAKLEEADLEKIARDLKLDVKRVKSAIASDRWQASIDDDTIVADGFQANGTPHFFINGRRLAGAQPLAAFSEIIDAELARAHALAAKGTAPSAIYDAATADGVAMAEPPTKDVALPAASAPWRGAAGAKVVVQEFADFQCPYCKKAEATIDELVKRYGGRVKIVWRNLPLPFHPFAELAAEAAMEAKAQKGSAGFWKMHDLLFANQGTDGGLSRSALDGYAAQLGLDRAKWAAALDGHAHSAAILADTSAADGAGINGTPAFVINGYYLGGAQPYARFKALVDRALASPAPGAAQPAAKVR